MYQDPTITTSTVIKGKDASQMGMDDFFNLLVAQLTNQDMMNPTNDTEFIAQMAQFSALQGVQTIQEYQLSSYAASYIGKFVTIANVKEDGTMETIVGKVDSITYYDGTPKVVVKGNTYDLFTVMEINDSDSSGALAQAMKFVNHLATVETVDEEGNKTQITGTVQGAGVSGGKPYVNVNGKKYDLESVLLVDNMEIEDFLKTLEDTDDITLPGDTPADNELPATWKATIGHEVTVTAYDKASGTEIEVTGKMTDAGVKDGTYNAVINGKYYDDVTISKIEGQSPSDWFEDNMPDDEASDVQRVSASSSGRAPFYSLTGVDSVDNLMLAIGQTVTAGIMARDGGNYREPLTGRLENAYVQGDKVYHVIDGTTYDDAVIDLVDGERPSDWLSSILNPGAEYAQPQDSRSGLFYL
jgi:flagellar basal-body rod modification protein FlgD